MIYFTKIKGIDRKGKATSRTIAVESSSYDTAAEIALFEAETALEITDGRIDSIKSVPDIECVLSENGDRSRKFYLIKFKGNPIDEQKPYSLLVQAEHIEHARGRVINETSYRYMDSASIAEQNLQAIVMRGTYEIGNYADALSAWKRKNDFNKRVNLFNVDEIMAD